MHWLCAEHFRKKESRFNISNPNPTFIFGLEFVRKIGFTFHMNIKIQHLPLGGNIFSQKVWNLSKNIFPRIRFKILDKRYANNFREYFPRIKFNILGVQIFFREYLFEKIFLRISFNILGVQIFFREYFLRVDLTF